jgi:hypothetical protein
MNAELNRKFRIQNSKSALARISVGATILLWVTLLGGTATAVTAYREQASNEADLVFRGLATGSLAGLSVARLGDVNGDGYPDFTVGMPGSNMAIIILARPFGHAIVDLSTAANQTGIIIVRANPSSGGRFGWSVCTASDFNGDGLDDVVIGWPGCNDRAPQAGAAVVLFGNPAWSNTAAPVVIDVASFTPVTGFQMFGSYSGDEAGASIAGGGDFNGDGFGDLVIAAPGASGATPAGGKFYVVFGEVSVSPVLNLETLGIRGFKIVCPLTGALAPGTSSTVCAWPGDVNQDGFDDLLLGTPLYRAGGVPETGAAWVLFGQTRPTWLVCALEDIGIGAPGTRILPDPAEAAGAHVGFAVAAAGDINADGRKDFAVSAPEGRWLGTGGVVAVVFGQAGLPPILDLGDLADDGVWIVDDRGDPNDRFGVSVAPAGDPNHDGVGDIVIGAPGQLDPGTRRSPAGHAYVVYCERVTSGVIRLNPPSASAAPSMVVGRRDKASQSEDFAIVDLVGTFGSARAGETGDLFGWSVCGPGDLNGDSVDDVLVGSPMSRPLFLQQQPVGHIFGFFFEPPRIVAVYLDDPNGNRQADVGERLNVVLNGPVWVEPGPINNLFFLANVGQLGADSLVRQGVPGSNRLQIVLGSQSSGIVVPGLGTALDFNASGERNRVISRRQGVNPTDNGVVGVNDTGVDIGFALAPVWRMVTPSGGVVTMPATLDTRYARHQMAFPAGSLASDTFVLFHQVTDPPGDFGLGSAVWMGVSQPFTQVRLTLGFRDDDVPAGMRKEQMRIVYMAEITPGVWELRRLPGEQIVDTMNNTISVTIQSPQPFSPPVGFEWYYGGVSGQFAAMLNETVDERKQGMEPTAGGTPRFAPARIGLSPSPGKQAIMSLTPGPFSLYTKHQLVFHDYATSTPGSVVVTLRSATPAERGYVVPAIRSQYFPDNSDAIFTIETTDASQTAVALTSPVDITVEYKLSGNPHGATDAVDFNGVPGPYPRLRIVRSVQSGVSHVPNFVSINGDQSVNADESVVQTWGYTNLTDSQGKATYGAVIGTPLLGATRWNLYR